MQRLSILFGMAQWKRAGPITQRTVDRNYLPKLGFSPIWTSEHSRGTLVFLPAAAATRRGRASRVARGRGAARTKGARVRARLPRPPPPGAALSALGPTRAARTGVRRRGG